MEFPTGTERKEERVMRRQSEFNTVRAVMQPVEVVKRKSDTSLLVLADTVPYQVAMTVEIEHNFDSIRSMFQTETADTVEPLWVELPPTSKKTLVLDLDETLIHAACAPPVSQLHNYRAVEFSSINDSITDPVTIYVTVRPHAKEILKELSDLYDIIVL